MAGALRRLKSVPRPGPKTLVASGWYPRAPVQRKAGCATTPLNSRSSRTTRCTARSLRRASRALGRANAAGLHDEREGVRIARSTTRTHGACRPTSREALPEELREHPRVYTGDLGPELVAELAHHRFRGAIEPLRAGGRLGLVLFQYPVWFTASRENEEKLLHTRELVPDCRVAIRFRNALWMNERHQKRTLDLLREADLVYTWTNPRASPPRSRPWRLQRVTSRSCASTAGAHRRWKRPSRRQRALPLSLLDPKSSASGCPEIAGSPTRPRPVTCSRTTAARTARRTERARDDVLARVSSSM